MARPKVRTEAVRERLLEEAMELLRAEGPSSVTARRVADAASSSTGALYELFGDKAGLVRALHGEALAMLDERQAAVPVTGDARHDLVELLAATRRFALEQPMLHEVMTGRPFDEFDPGEEDSAIARRLYRRGVEFTERFLASVGAPVDAKVAAEVLVAAHRGLLQAELAGILGRSPRSRDRKYHLGVEVLLRGLAPGVAPPSS